MKRFRHIGSFYRFARQALCLVVILLAAAAVSQAAGVPDTSFGNAGTVRVGTQIQDPITDIVFTGDGNMIVVVPDTHGATDLYRLLSNGTLDPSFGSGGLLVLDSHDIRVVDALVQPDGKILLAGAWFPPVGKTDFCILRLLSDGSRDPEFGTDGRFTLNQGTQDIINNIALLPDGRIVGAGVTSDEGWTQAVLRVLPNGTADTSFGGGGMELFKFPLFAPDSSVGNLQQIRVLPDGRMLLGTWLYVSQGTSRGIGYALAMMTADGDLDPSFGSDGTVMAVRTTLGFTTGVSFEVMPSGNIFVAYASGVSMLTANGSFIRYLPLEAQGSELLHSGRVLAWGEGLSYGAPSGPIQIYSETGLIGKSALLGHPYASPDGRIIVASIDYGHGQIVLRALQRLTSQGTRIADFDRDDRSDVAVMQGIFFHSQNSSGSRINLAAFDQAQVIPELSEQRKANGEVDRDTVVFASRGIPGLSGGRYARVSWLSTGSVYFSAPWGIAGDIPAGGDFDGDGMVDMTVFRPSNGYWFSIFGENGQNRYVQWGAQGDKPVPADYDYDGKTDFAVYRPSTGTWWIRRSTDGQAMGIQFGIASDIPLTGDFDGDGYADLTVFRPSEGNWYQYLTTEGFRVIKFGVAGDYPVPGDYDGDGRHDIAVYRAGTWYLLQSTAGFTAITPAFASAGETPVAVRYDQ
jgi:uncharacterized delta-60 repeat protein